MNNPERPNAENPNEAGSEGKIFTEVYFVEKKDKKGKIVAYQSSIAGRKPIKLFPTGVIDIDKPYKIKIIGDSSPEDPYSGYYIGEITEESPIEKTDWPDVEEAVSVAEVSQRQLNKSRFELHQETGVLASDRAHLSSDEILHTARRPRVAAKALEGEEQLTKEVLEILGKPNSTERKMVSFRYAGLREAISGDREITQSIQGLRAEESEILRTISDEPSSSELEALNEIHEELSRAESRREQLIQSSPEAYYGLHLKRLKKYKEDLEEGRIVETSYVIENIDDIVSHVRAGKPVMIYGHLGSGKTELALHVARNYILSNRPDLDEVIGREFDEWLSKNPGASRSEQEKEKKEIETVHRSALVISGSKNMSTTELYGHQVLDIKKIKKDELDSFVQDVEEKYKKWLEDNVDKLRILGPGVAEQEKNRAHDRFLQTYLTQFKGGTISDFFLGPIYRAMAEGRPVIIDEINAIPHEVLISLNHVLTRKVGDEVNVQQNSGTAITIKEGYGVIVTGNLNQGDGRYIDRQEMDPAFLSRLYKIEYDYLPQKTDGSLEEEAGEGNELFHLLLSRVMDKNGNIEIPDGAVDGLWRLAKAARVIQNVFAGKETNNAYYFRDGGMRPVQYMLKESVLSIRGIDKVITQWQKEGYKQELDYYLWREFVSQSTNPTDKAYLYQLLKDQFGFFATPGWEQRPNYGSGGVINSFDIKAPKNLSETIDFIGPRKVVDFAFGKGPKRERWPNSGGKLYTNKDEALESEVEEIKTQTKKEAPKNPESAESVDTDLTQFMAEIYKNWGVSQDRIDKFLVSPTIRRARDFSMFNFSTMKDDIDPSKFGEMIMSNETASVDWDSIPQNKIKTEKLPVEVGGKSLAEIGEYIKTKYGNKYKVPGLEYYKYICENPDKAPDSLKDGNYHFFFGSLFRDSGGDWNVPCVHGDSSGFNRDGDRLVRGWVGSCRVVLLEN